jgi:cytochrome c-type biogenesis protein CcmH
MMTFLIAAALMLTAALFFILPTLLRRERSGTAHAQRDALNLDVLRDQLRELDVDRQVGVIDDAGYESARRELERRVAEDVQPGVQTVAATGKPWPAIVVGLLLPAVAVALYWLLGNPVGLDPLQVARTIPAQQSVTPEQITAMVDKLASHLKEKPEDIEGWNMLARSYNALGRYGDAADAYGHLIKLVPPNAELLADYADSLAMSRDKTLQGEPEKIIARALEVDPTNVKALALSGEASYERHDYSTAVAQWKKILAAAPPGSDIARSVASSIDEAQTLARTSNDSPAMAPADVPSPAAAASAAAPSASDVQVSGTVELDAALRSKVTDTDTVFIFARAVDGPRFPLAVLRKQVKDLPVTFVLDDSMSMMPNAKLSGFPTVVVGARISKSGSATPGAGDLEGLTEPVHPGAKNLKIRINTQHQ